MKNPVDRFFTGISLFIVAIFASLVWLAVSGPSIDEVREQKRPSRPAQLATRFFSVEAEGHRWIVMEAYSSSFRHHPDCPCGKP